MPSGDKLEISLSSMLTLKAYWYRRGIDLR